MSDEVKMPDPKVEAKNLWEMVPCDECAGWLDAEPYMVPEIRSLMARTLRAAAESPEFIESCEYSDPIVALERMASEIEKPTSGT